jgi:hypothetical protein
VFCNQCGANNAANAHFCAKCGATMLGTHAGPGSGQSNFSNNVDIEAAGGAAASVFSRGIVGDVAGYTLSHNALNRLESSGQGDSAMADVARTGLMAAKVKIGIGIAVVVVMAIIAISALSSFHNAQNQFNNFNNNAGLNNSGGFPNQQNCWTSIPGTPTTGAC